MKDYEALFCADGISLNSELINKYIGSAESWKDAYQIGQFIEQQETGEDDMLIMDAYEKAFELGLNVRTDRECFLNATKSVAKICFLFQKYEEARNKMMLVEANEKNPPDWINLYYVSAYIHTEEILYWAEEPEQFFFKRLNSIDETDIESVTRRKYLFLEFLDRITELSKTRDCSDVNSLAICKKADELGLSDTEELHDFRAAMGMPAAVFPTKPEYEHKQAESIISVYEERIEELNELVVELQNKINEQNSSLLDKDFEITGLKERIGVLTEENHTAEKAISVHTRDLKKANEKLYALESKCDALEKRLAGSEAEKTRLQRDSSKIGELQADVDDLNSALSLTKKKNKQFIEEIENYKKTINSLNNDLQKYKANADSYISAIENQKQKIRTLEEALTAARIKGENSEHELQTSLSSPQSAVPDIYQFKNYLGRREKILIIGGAKVKEEKIRGRLKHEGFKFEKDQLEFILDYDETKNYADRINKQFGRFKGIIVGPCPHKVKGMGDHNSFIDMIESKGYSLHVEEAREKSGALKITNESVVDAMSRMARHLLTFRDKSEI